MTGRPATHPIVLALAGFADYIWIIAPKDPNPDEGTKLAMTGARLAVDGGEPAFPGGPPGWPAAEDEVRDAMLGAFRDGSWGRYHGPHGRRLAELLSAMHGGSHVKLCCSGTAAVELALRGLKVGPGDEVILAGYDFPGNFRCIEAVGARPVLVDIDTGQASLDPSRLDAAHSDKVSAIVVSHLHGGMADMPSICHWARQHGVAVVEDACQAPGGTAAGRMAGTWGDTGTLSFGGSKLLTAGRGGAVITPHAEVFQRMKVYADRGNEAYPLSELQAAVLVPQLGKLEARNQHRRRNAQRLLDACRQLPELQPIGSISSTNLPGYYKLGWYYDRPAAADSAREEFTAALQAEGVAIDGGFRGFTQRSARRCRQAGQLGHSDYAARTTVLLHHPILLESEEAIDRLAMAFRKVITAHRTRGEVMNGGSP